MGIPLARLAAATILAILAGAGQIRAAPIGGIGLVKAKASLNDGVQVRYRRYGRRFARRRFRRGAGYRGLGYSPYPYGYYPGYYPYYYAPGPYIGFGFRGFPFGIW